ncbi:MAG: transposase [Patescibacteria group bacterium]|nr:transposase [Patescibacteria group bacterium]
MRKVNFQNRYYYHVYNRGVDKRRVFVDKKDYLRFMRSLREFNDKKVYGGLFIKDKIKKLNQDKRGSASLEEAEPLVDIICYALLPNHYHFLLRQRIDNGISTYIHKLITAYTMYFNYKHKRTGGLFQGKFKAVSIKTDEQLLYTSAYINGNAEIHKICQAEDWNWSSYLDYLGVRKETESLRFEEANRRDSVSADTKIILKEFTNIDDYQEYVSGVIKNSSGIKEELKQLEMEK